MSHTDAKTTREAGMFAKALFGLVSRIPDSEEPESQDPHKMARGIARRTAVKAAGISGSLSLPPGPLGLATLLPDLLAIWNLQKSMVADIASVFGKSGSLTRETMVVCLFKHGGAALTRDLMVRAGQRLVVRAATVETLQRILQRIGIRLSERLLARTLARSVPVIGALGVGAYAYFDTSMVATNAIEIFSSDLRVQAEKEKPPALPS